jgi:ribosomal protein L7/L12
MNVPPFLRIRWNVVPRASKFLGYLGAHTRIAEPVSLMQDFTQLQSLSLDEQQKQLRDLVGRGQIIAAIYIARKMHGCSLAEAKEMVERLRKPP